MQLVDAFINLIDGILVGAIAVGVLAHDVYDRGVSRGMELGRRERFVAVDVTPNKRGRVT